VLNYTKDDFNLLIGRLYNRRKKTHGGQVPGSRSGHFDNSFNRTAETIATEHGMSPKSVQRGTGSNQYVQSGQNDHSAKTEHDVAEQFGVSPRTVRRAAKFNEKVEEENKLEIRTGFR
jgi:AraC-like DNA-binding protein